MERSQPSEWLRAALVGTGRFVETQVTSFSAIVQELLGMPLPPSGPAWLPPHLAVDRRRARRRPARLPAGVLGPRDPAPPEVHPNLRSANGAGRLPASVPGSGRRGLLRALARLAARRNQRRARPLRAAALARARVARTRGPAVQPGRLSLVVPQRADGRARRCSGRL